MSKLKMFNLTITSEKNLLVFSDRSNINIYNNNFNFKLKRLFNFVNIKMLARRYIQTYSLQFDVTGKFILNLFKFIEFISLNFILLN